MARALRSAGRLAGVLALLLCLSLAQAKKTKGPLTEDQLKDREALIALKGAVAPNGWGTSKLRSWKLAGSPCAGAKPWPGVTCWSGRVVALELSNMNIQATLPVKLRQLNQLRTLKLDGNKITGTIPTEWADSRFFMSLQTLDLHDNLLEGTLPSAKWNKKNSFRALQTLDLSQNNLRGGLPYGWLSTNRVFRELKFLDLSQNQLGYAYDPNTEGAQYGTTSDWCTGGPGTLGADDSQVGWCPTGTPLKDAMAGLVTLDLSENGFVGPLPAKWPIMFPSLQFLMLAKNNLWNINAPGSNTAGLPAPLPKTWTQPTYPIAFPALESLTLYPGNDNLCFLPNTKGFQIDGYANVNTDLTYKIYDLDEDEYNTDSPFQCTGPTGLVNSQPDGVAVTLVNGKMVVSWSVTEEEASFLYGFKISHSFEDVSNDEMVLNQKWNSKMYRTYVDGIFTAANIDAALTVSAPAGGSITYTLATGLAPMKAADGNVGRQLFEVVSFNLDGQDSASNEATLN